MIRRPGLLQGLRAAGSFSVPGRPAPSCYSLLSEFPGTERDSDTARRLTVLTTEKPYAPGKRDSRRSMKLQWLAAKVSVLFLALCCLAQPPSVPQQQSPITTLHAATRLILLDVVVTDKHGKPARSLSKDDFPIQEEGDHQPIPSFEPPPSHSPPPLQHLSLSHPTRTIPNHP